MPQQAPTKIIIDPTLVERADIHCPTYMPRTVFLNFLIQEGLDKRASLGKQPGSPAAEGGSGVLPLKVVNKEEEERAREAAEFAAAVKKKPASYTPGFESFWKIYQSCPDSLRARSQSKPKAFDAYRAALKSVDAADLFKAAQKAVEGQLDAQSRDEWAPALPDAFRWLKDGKYEALLEEHAPAQAEYKGDWL